MGLMINRDVFAGAGPVADAVRAANWDAAGLGAVGTWSAAMLAALDLCLRSPFPMVLLCGARFAYIANGPACALFGDEHMATVGRPAAEVWRQAWPVLGPLVHTLRRAGAPGRRDDVALAVRRGGIVQDASFTFSCCPVGAGRDGSGGVLVSVLETTVKPSRARRLSAMPVTAGPAVQLAHEGLTAREREVASLIGSGCQIKQVAARLEISVSSVNTYRARIFRKMGLASNAALIRYAVMHGLAN